MGVITFPEGLGSAEDDNNGQLENLINVGTFDNVEDAEEIKKRLATLHLLYAAGKVTILSLANKLAVASIENVATTDLSDAPAAVEVPVADSWNFRLGDWVRIKCSMADFKSIQSETLGWTPRLRNIHEYDAVVTKRYSPFSNSVTIYTPTTLSESSIYAGVLEKVPEHERQSDTFFTSQWKVNDYVILREKNVDKVIKLFQRGLDDIPQRYIGRRGRIIAVTKVAIVVTFNERTSYDIKSALLTKSSDQHSPLDVSERTHERGLVLGQKVRVHSDVSKLIEAQKEHGGWAMDMTKCVGEEVTIVHIRKDGGLFVQYKNGKHWLMNPESVSTEDDSQAEHNSETAPSFKPGDVVKIKTIENARALMNLIDIPTDLMEYLRATAEVKLIDDDLDYMITFNGVQSVNIRSTFLRMATAEEKIRHVDIKAKVAGIKVGSLVYLDVGPPNFVKSILRDSGVDPAIVKAMTTPSVLKGYDRDGKALIEYEDRKRYSVRKKYLTVPSKFHVRA